MYSSHFSSLFEGHSLFVLHQTENNKLTMELQNAFVYHLYRNIFVHVFYSQK